MKKNKNNKKLKKWVKNVFIAIIIISALNIIIVSYGQTKKVQKKQIKVKDKDEVTDICKKIDYCNKSYYKRYKAYYKKNKDLSKEEIITRVNMGIDNSFYTNTKETPYPNKTYILVNKYYHLGKDYIPDNLENINENYSRSGMKLVREAKEAFEELSKASIEDNKKVLAMSSYRSYEYQVNLYNKYVENDGIKEADTYSARPGYSEHQTGLCVDVYDGRIDYTNFEKSDSYNWMQENAYKYGFILRFPKGKENLTGYQYESWHYRYVGKKIAKYIKENDLTLEEYYAKFIEGKK